MSAGLFQLRLLRAVNITGRRMVAGSLLQADAFAAVDMVRTGAAVLVNDEDLPRLLELIGARRPGLVTR